MPVKFHIHTEPTPPRVRPVGKMGIVDWREDCSSCHNCVKKDCVYGFYRDEADRLREELGYLDYIYQCKGCLNCIQEGCTFGGGRCLIVSWLSKKKLKPNILAFITKSISSPLVMMGSNGTLVKRFR